MSSHTINRIDATTDRQGWMGLLARAKPALLAARMPEALPDHSLLRAPEIGAVMVQGRAGATGARLLVTLLHTMKDQGKKRGLATLCIGGGEALAVVIER